MPDDRCMHSPVKSRKPALEGRMPIRPPQSLWCPWPESNQHSLRNSILSRARLPIPPQGHFALSGKAEVAKPAEYSARGPAVNPRVPGYAEARCRRSAYPSPRWTMIRLRRVPTEPKHSPVKAAARQVPVSATRTDAITQMSFLSLIGNGAVAIRQPAYPFPLRRYYFLSTCWTDDRHRALQLHKEWA